MRSTIFPISICQQIRLWSPVWTMCFRPAMFLNGVCFLFCAWNFSEKHEFLFDRLKWLSVVQTPEATVYQENLESICLTNFHCRCGTVETRGLLWRLKSRYSEKLFSTLESCTRFREVHLGILNRFEIVTRWNHFVDPRIFKRSINYIEKKGIKTVPFAAYLKSKKIASFWRVWKRMWFEQIELQAKLLNYFLGNNKSNINQVNG